MAEAESLITRYNVAEASNLSLEVSMKSFQPAWENYPATQIHARTLETLSTMPAIVKKSVLQSDFAAFKSLVDALSMADVKPVQYVLTMLCDMLREDSSAYNLYEDGLKHNLVLYQPMMTILRKGQGDSYVADKSAWLLTGVIGNVPAAFTMAQVTEVVKVVQDSQVMSDLGVIDALVNILKADTFRKDAWNMQGVKDRITGVSPQSASPPVLYKCIFGLWMLSFEPQGNVTFNEEMIAQKLRDVLIYSRVEKVVRLTLTVVKNFLTSKKFTEHLVEFGVLEVVQQLEYEKWRDSELYDDIRDMSSLISAKVQELSSFERYERELKEGKLKWGFIHSSKFWAENVLKFEQNDFRALKMLASMLRSHDTTTLAVACHDLGEFVTMHPLGKKQISNLGVKEEVMELMAKSSPDYREVRREALLCCQKIMLNKWQDVEGTA